MKTLSSNRRQCDGSVLMIALLVALILGLTLASYLLLVRSQNASVMRSQAWNRALAVAEAGIEEALAQLNPAALNFNTNIDRAANGWGSSGGFYGPAQRALLDGDYGVVISADTFPVIYSTGYTAVPALSAKLERVVRVEATTAPSFQVAMAAKDTIEFKGTTVWIDSYDSADQAYSTDGFYDPGKKKAGGDVASIGGLINYQNADIKGKVLTGPTAPAPTGNTGEAGDLNWTGPGIQPGWYRNDFNVEFPDVLPPYSSGLQPTAIQGQGGITTNLLGGFKYYVNGNMNLKAGDVMHVTGKATLYVTGEFIMQSGGGKSSQIIIAPNASLKLFVGGPSAIFTTVNTSGNAATFQYYGLPSNTSLVWNGNAQYLGTVYAPQATFELGGGGNNTMDYQGACVVGAVVMNGKFNFHYDENLRRIGPINGYRVVAWREL